MNDTFPVIDGHTKLTGLLGSPVSHSISPLMHNEAFRLLNLNYVYLCFDVPEANLADTVKGLRCMNIAGFNCTMPDKTKICELIDDLSDAARMIGAVNTVVNKNGRLVGHNTDGIGYMQAVKEACDLEVSFLRLLTVLRLSSSTRVMLVSISAAFAPGYIVMTEICGISISGYWSTARFFSEKSPSTITPTNISTVEIGLRTALS